jgi:hypothetical protein
MVIGSGNDRPTPRIVLDILGVDPSQDPESVHEYAPFSYDVGNLHVSVIFNPSFICKIQVLINYKGKIEHIVELIFYKSIISYFSPELTNIYPHKLTTGIYVANVFDLLENNIEAYVSRIKKKLRIEKIFDGSEEAIETLVQMNTKINNTIERIVILINKIDTILLKFPIKELISRYKRSIEYLLLHKNNTPIILSRLCRGLRLVEGELNKVFNANILDFCEFKLSPANNGNNSANAPAAKATPANAPAAKATPVNTTPVNVPLEEEWTLVPMTKKSKQPIVKEFIVFDEGPTDPFKNITNEKEDRIEIESLRNNSMVFRAAARKAKPQKHLNNMSMRNFNKELKNAMKPYNNFVSVTPLMRQTSTKVVNASKKVDVIIINEPIGLAEPYRETYSISGNEVEQEYRKTLLSILSFLKKRDPEFVFVYIMPSVSYSYYKGVGNYISNILLEDISINFIFTLYSHIIQITIMPKGDKDMIMQGYNEILIVMDQLSLHKIITDEERREIESIFNTKDFIVHFKKNDFSQIINSSLTQMKLLISLLIFNLLNKNNITRQFKYNTKDDVYTFIESYIRQKAGIQQFLIYLVGVRVELLYNILKTSDNNIYVFIPNYILGQMPVINQATNKVIKEDFLRVFTSTRFNIKPLPMTSFKLLFERTILSRPYPQTDENQFYLEYNASVIEQKIFKKKITKNQKNYIGSLIYAYANIILNPDTFTEDSENKVVTELFDIILAEKIDDVRMEGLITESTKYIHNYLYADLIILHEIFLDRQIEEARRYKDEERVAILMSKKEIMMYLDRLMFVQDIYMASNFPKYIDFSPKIIRQEDLVEPNRKQKPVNVPQVEGMNRKSRKGRRMQRRQTRKK